MKHLKLSNRLSAVAALLGPCGGVVDVGTDHGYLPVYLAQGGMEGRIVAADIKKGPLQSAITTADEYGVSSKIEFILTDGLTAIVDAGLDAVVLAGMGGETMLGILEKAVWTRTRPVRCVLQPQTKTDELTDWLRENGYKIMDAALAEDDGRLYLIFTAAAGEDADFTEPLDVLLKNRDGLLPRYLEDLIKKTRRALGGLVLSRNLRDGETQKMKAALLKYSRMKEETDTWQR